MTRYPPTTDLEQRIVQLIEKHKPILDRWSSGVSHRKSSDYIVRCVAAIDWLYFGDSFHMKVGGDGDNGETLAFILDLFFDLCEVPDGLSKIPDD